MRVRDGTCGPGLEKGRGGSRAARRGRQGKCKEQRPEHDHGTGAARETGAGTSNGPRAASDGGSPPDGSTTRDVEAPGLGELVILYMLC